MNHSQTVVSYLINSLPIIGEKFWVPYLAVPYKHNGRDLNGWDCFGAVRYILAHHADIELPMFDAVSASEITRQSKRKIWHPQFVTDKFDVVCIDLPTSKGKRPLHVGVMVSEIRLLHCDEGYGTVCVPINHYTIKNRIQTIYRHEALLK